DVVRYTRHKSLAIERKLFQHRKFQVKRAQALAQWRETRAGERSERDNEPATQLEHLIELEDKVDGSVQDVDEILTKPPVELEHARALEATFDYIERLDACLAVAIARRNSALEQMDRYRDGLGARWRRASDDIIEIEGEI